VFLCTPVATGLTLRFAAMAAASRASTPSPIDCLRLWCLVGARPRTLGNVSPQEYDDGVEAGLRGPLSRKYVSMTARGRAMATVGIAVACVTLAFVLRDFRVDTGRKMECRKSGDCRGRLVCRSRADRGLSASDTPRFYCGEPLFRGWEDAAGCASTAECGRGEICIGDLLVECTYEPCASQVAGRCRPDKASHSPCDAAHPCPNGQKCGHRHLLDCARQDVRCLQRAANRLRSLGPSPSDTPKLCVAYHDVF
jgi:hypothetical protein